MDVAAHRRAEDETIAFHLALAAIGIAIVGELAFAVIDRGVTHLLLARVAHALLGAALLVVLARRKPHPAVRTSVAAFSAMSIGFLPVFWLAETAMLGTTTPWVPFLGHRLLFIGIGLLAPGPARVGAGLVALACLQVVALWFALDLPAVPHAVTIGEPVATLLVAALSIALLWQRDRRRRLEQRWEAARVEAQALERLAVAFLAVRDRANTPLQTLMTCLALLRVRHPEEGPLLDRLARALARLRELARTFDRAEREVQWTSGEESLDAQARLNRFATQLEERSERQLEP